MKRIPLLFFACLVCIGSLRAQDGVHVKVNGQNQPAILVVPAYPDASGNYSPTNPPPSSGASSGGGAITSPLGTGTAPANAVSFVFPSSYTPMFNLSGAIPAGTNLIGGVNNAQVGGVAIATGAGASNTGTQRVVISGDSTVTINPTVSSTSNDPAPVAVSTTSATALAANAARLGCVFTNDGTTKCYLSFGTAQAAGRGIPLAAGAYYTMDLNLLYRGPVYVVTATGTTTLVVHEQ